MAIRLFIRLVPYLRLEKHSASGPQERAEHHFFHTGTTSTANNVDGTLMSCLNNTPMNTAPDATFSFSIAKPTQVEIAATGSFAGAAVALFDGPYTRPSITSKVSAAPYTTALYDATFFADAYDRFCHLIGPNRPFLLTGRVEEDYGVCSLRVEQLERL